MIAANSLPGIARDLDLAKNVTRVLKIVCGEELCLRVIVAGIVLEPSAAVTEAINRSNARLLRLLGKRPAHA